MLFMVGVETPKNNNEAWGAIVPVFDSVDYLCVAAADKEADLLNNVKLAILDMAEEALNDGRLLSELESGFNSDYAKQYPDFDKWFALEVTVEALQCKQKRINVSLPETLIARMDCYVAANPLYVDRSDFLAKAANNQMNASERM